MYVQVGDTRVVIEEGELICGMLDKKSLGTSGGSLIHVTWNEYGPPAARAFIGVWQRVVNYWIVNRGYSIGIGDTIADAKTMDDIVQTIDSSKKEVKALVEKAQNNQLECQPGRTMLESFENNVNQVLNKARDTAGTRAQKSLKETNNVKNMVTTGSKGSFINISQMIACVGQQNVEGKRIPYGFLNRTLPHFTKDDYGEPSLRAPLRPVTFCTFVSLHLCRPGVARLRRELVLARAHAAGLHTLCTRTAYLFTQSAPALRPSPFHRQPISTHLHRNSTSATPA